MPRYIYEDGGADRFLNLYDPLLYNLPLPIERTLFPLGYPLLVTTNSPEVESAAAKLWGRYPRLFEESPVRLRIAVSADAPVHPPVPVLPRGHGHLITAAHGMGNVAAADLSLGFTGIDLTPDVAADPVYLTYHFVEPFVYFMLAARRFAIVHGACVAREGKALLLCGDSGAGKTCLAWECARRGWNFLSGDVSQLVCEPADFEVVGRPYSIRFRDTARQLFPELAGYVAARSPNGKLDLDIATNRLGASVTPRATLSHFIFLDRKAGSRPEISAVSVEEAYSQLRKMIFYGPETMRERHRATLRHYLRLPALRLRYSDLDAAERCLRGLVE